MKLFAAEFFGTFVLVLVGTGAMVLNDVTGGGVTSAGVALAFGVAVAGMILAVGNISGAHLNPAVTLGFWMTGRFPAALVLPYWLGQCGGALLASFLLGMLTPAHPTLGATLPGMPVAQAFGIECVLAGILMFVILNVSHRWKEKGTIAALAVGGTVALEAFFAGPLTGASMNPARSLGPAIASGQLSHLWLYLTAPMLGAVLAVWFCRCTQPVSCCVKGLEA